MDHSSQSKLVLNEVREKLKTLDGLPPFPATASQILMQCQKPDVDTHAVAQLVECEPAICAKVIQLANSPLFGATRPIVSINHAIVLLGFNSVSQMAIAIAASSVFEQGDPEFSKHRNRTFRQSLACAIASRMLATNIKSANPDEAFLCGVMHDVGKLVLFDAAAKQYCEILERESYGDTTATELAAFDIDHAGLGKKCGVKWGLPAQINAAIEKHHRNLAEITDSLSAAVIAGNYYARRWSLAGNEEIVQPCIAEIDDEFSTSDLASMEAECLDQLEAIIEICAM